MRIKKGIFAVLLSAACIVMFTGCSFDTAEINQIAIVAGIAIDKGDDDYAVTVQILNPSAIAGETQTLPVYSIKTNGMSIHDAFNKLDQITTSALSLSHLNAIVINEEFAKDGIAPVLNFALRRFDIRPDISIVIAKDSSANDILNIVTALDMIPASQINVLAMVQRHTGRLTSSNLYETVDLVNTTSSNVVLNAVSIHREEEHIDEDVAQKDGSIGKTSNNGSTVENALDIAEPVQLRIEHLAAFQGDKLAGFITDAEAQLYNMIMGKQKRYTIVTEIEKNYYSSLGVASVKSKISTDLENNEATIKMTLTGLILENTYPIDLSTRDNLAIMSEYYKKQFEKDMNDFIKKTQTEFKSDIFGIGGKAHNHENKIWIEKEGYWAEIFPELTINLEVEVKVDTEGAIGNVTL